jgi:uncharacterized membrane protein
MDDELVLIAIAVLAMPVLLIIFMIWTVQLSRRVRTLEAVMVRGAPANAIQPIPEPEPETPAAVPVKSAPATTMAEAMAGPWDEPRASAPPPKTPTSLDEVPSPPKAVVFRADRLSALSDWLRVNWIYAVSAVSLALAGLFLVQYGVETGLLTPTARVAAALIFGAALVAGGEYIRRRWGDASEATTAFLPSVFSGAGIVTLFGSVLAAVHLYGLIGPGAGLAGLIVVAAVAIGLGWYSGPLLAALGIAGADLAPFLVGGESDMPELFYGYFALVALVGLGIDAVKRWAWVSVLALGLAYPAVTLLWLGADWPEFYAMVLVGLAIASMAVPLLTLSPKHGGATLVESFFKGRPRGWPEFPTRLVAGSMFASTLGLMVVALDGAGAFWIALVGLTVLFFAVAVWADRAEALEDLAVLPALAMVSLPVLVALGYVAPYVGFVGVLYAEEGTPVPNDPYILVAFGVALSLMAAWRSRRGARWPVAWGAGAALAAPAMVVGIEFSWMPAFVLGAYPWALTVIAVAAVMVALALGFAKHDGESRPRVAGFTLAALAMIALALALIFSETALTLAFAVVTVAAAALDRRLNLRPLSVAVQIGAIALGWRLIFDPGLGWAEGAPYWELALAYGGAIAALIATRLLLRTRRRPAAELVAESAAWTLGAVFANVLVARVIEDAAPGTGLNSHWAMSLMGLVWLVSAANQLWRTQIGGFLVKVRWVLAVLFGAGGALYLAAAVFAFNPMLNTDPATRVLGPVIANTLVLAYALPALLLAFVAWRFDFLNRILRRALAIAAIALGVLWLFLAIRHFWRGTEIGAAGFSEPELYTYTIAMLITGAGLLYQAIAGRSALLRKAAMAVIGLTVAKVFLVDIAGLVGLLRVFSFLALGLALAGLAFLNRWAASRIGTPAA